MGDNILVMIGCAAAGGGLALVFALVLSATIRRRGLLGAIRREVSATARLRNPYRG